MNDEHPPLDLTKPFERDGASGDSPPMLRFVKKTGNSTALPYSMLAQVEFDPSGELVLDFSTVTATVTGSNLGEIHQAIIEQQLSIIRESPGKEKFTGEEDDPFVKSIDIT